MYFANFPFPFVTPSLENLLSAFTAADESDGSYAPLVTKTIADMSGRLDKVARDSRLLLAIASRLCPDTHQLDSGTELLLLKLNVRMHSECCNDGFNIPTSPAYRGQARLTLKRNDQENVFTVITFIDVYHVLITYAEIDVKSVSH